MQDPLFLFGGIAMKDIVIFFGKAMLLLAVLLAFFVLMTLTIPQ